MMANSKMHAGSRATNCGRNFRGCRSGSRLHAGWLITGSNSTASHNVCLIVVAFKAHPEFPLIVAANRDEFHARPSQAADWWADQPNIVGGRDLLAGGTWLAAHRDGRFSAVTNYRDAEPKRGKLTSRGVLVTRYLLGR